MSSPTGSPINVAAAKTDKLLQEQFERDPKFKCSVTRIELVYAFAFSPAATKCIELLMKDLTAFPLSLFDEWDEAFVVMAELGFFSQTSARYQMTIPKAFTPAKIKAALLRLAKRKTRIITCIRSMWFIASMSAPLRTGS